MHSDAATANPAACSDLSSSLLSIHRKMIKPQSWQTPGQLQLSRRVPDMCSAGLLGKTTVSHWQQTPKAILSADESDNQAARIANTIQNQLVNSKLTNWLLNGMYSTQICHPGTVCEDLSQAWHHIALCLTVDSYPDSLQSLSPV